MLILLQSALVTHQLGQPGAEEGTGAVGQDRGQHCSPQDAAGEEPSKSTQESAQTLRGFGDQAHTRMQEFTKGWKRAVLVRAAGLDRAAPWAIISNDKCI